MGPEMKQRLKSVLMWTVIALIVLLSALNVILTLRAGASHEEYVDRKVEELKNIQLANPVVVNGIDGKDGTTPVKGVDYFDGVDGADGLNGENGKDGVDGEDGKDAGPTDIRCNEEKNRWEVRYPGNQNWQIQYGASGEPVKCTLGE